MTEKQSRLRSFVSAVLIALVIATIMVSVIFIRWKADMEKHPTDKLEAYLEECFGEEVAVSFDTLMYFTSYISSDLIPYLATVTLADGESLTFCVQWERDTAVDNGVYAEYGSDLIDHYAYKYGIEGHETSNWTEIHLTKEDLLGADAAFLHFFDALWNSQYVQSGQELDLYLESDIGHSFQLTMTLEDPVSYEAVFNRLTEFQK